MDRMSAYRLDDYRRMSTDELDAMLFGLAVECPFGNCQPSCPLDPLRAQPLRARFLYINGLSHAGKLRLLGRMAGCFDGLQCAEAPCKNT